MNKPGSEATPDLVDRIALELQRLRSAQRLDGNQPLLRIDNRREAAKAPYQFDISESVLHRSECSSIPKRSRSALYALWEVRPEDLKYACSHCRPEAREEKAALPDPSDLIYGIFSLLDQFGSILVERGREYRSSESGRRLEATVGSMIGQLDGQPQVAGALFEQVDGLVRALQHLAGNGNGESARPASNGSAPTAAAPTAESRQTTTTSSARNGHAKHAGNGRSNGIAHPKAERVSKQQPK